MTSDQVASHVSEAQSIATVILATIGAVSPGTAGETAAAEAVVLLASKLATAALGAYGAASNTPITSETVQALLPNATPLTAPDAA